MEISYTPSSTARTVGLGHAEDLRDKPSDAREKALVSILGSDALIITETSENLARNIDPTSGGRRAQAMKAKEKKTEATEDDIHYEQVTVESTEAARLQNEIEEKIPLKA